MPADSIQSLRLAFKRTFANYMIALESPGIADPTEVFESARAYLRELYEQLGTAELFHRLDDDTTHLAGQVEQDLRHRLKGGGEMPEYDDIEDRLRECFEYGLSQLPRRR